MKQLIAMVTFILCSCGGGRSTDSDAIETTAQLVQKPQSNSCLVEMATHPGDLLPVSTASKLIGVPETDIKQRLGAGIGPSNEIKWNTGRKRIQKAGKIEIEVDVDNVVYVELRLLDEKIKKMSNKIKDNITYEEYFTKYHTPFTEASKSEVKERLDKTDESDTVKKVAKSMVGVIQFENFNTIDGIGDMAVSQVNATGEKYGAPRKTELSVLHGNVDLLVLVDVSKNDDEDLALAKAVAKAVLASCN